MLLKISDLQVWILVFMDNVPVYKYWEDTEAARYT